MIPSVKLSTKSVCQGSRCSDITTYDWILYEEDQSVLNSSVVWRKRDDLQLLTSTPLNSSFIVIKENSLLGGRNYRLAVFVLTSDGLSGMSAYSISTTLPPIGGECSIKPTSGISLETNFTLSCSGWKSDSEPLSYQFQYQLYNGLNSVIYHGLNNSVVSQLPSGDLNFSATVTDKNGVAASVMNLTVKVGVNSLILKKWRAIDL